MTENNKTITDEKFFSQVCNKFFQNNRAFLKSIAGNLEVKYIDYFDGIIVFEIPHRFDITEKNIFFIRSINETVFVHCSFYAKEDLDRYLFKVRKFEIASRERREERKNTIDDGGKGERAVFLTNVISDFIMSNALSYQYKKIGKIRESILAEIEKHFSYVKIFICYEDPRNTRMKYFQTNREIIYIPDIYDKNLADKKINHYLNNIYNRDFSLRNKEKYHAEISIPFMYRMKLPFGYIQVNHTEVLTESSLSALKKVAMKITAMFSKEKIFPVFDEKFIVKNIAKGGFGIILRDKKTIRNFKENCSVYADILLPDNKRVSILSTVKNINILENNTVNVGFSIVDIDALSEVHYEEYIDSLVESVEKPSKT